MLNKQLAIAAIGAVAFLGICSQAFGGSLSASKSVTVAAPADEVWATVGNFGGIDAWHPAIVKAEIVSGTNNEPGAVRKLTLGGKGGHIKEQLKEYDGAGLSYTYVILGGVLPVVNYRSTISVEAVDDSTSKMTWAGTFDAAEGAKPDAVQKSIAGIYAAGLANVQKMMGSN